MTALRVPSEPVHVLRLIEKQTSSRLSWVTSTCTALLKARCDLRQDGTTAADARIDFNNQITQLKRLTDRYSKDALELLFKTVGVDRCLFGTERPGVGTVKDPRTGRWLDETRFTIEAIDWLTPADRKMIFEDNAKKLFNLKVTETVAA